MEDEAKHNIDKLIDDLNNLRLEVSLEECPNVDQVLDSVANISKTPIEETTIVAINKVLLTLLRHKSKQIVAKTAKGIAEIAKTDRGKKNCTTIELIPALIDLLKEDDIDISIQACSALWNICDENENGRKLVREQDCLKVILTVLKKGIALDNVESARFLRIEATEFLYQFLWNQKALCMKALEEDMLSILCSILELDFQNGISNGEASENVCVILCVLDDVNIVFLDERFATALIDIITMDISFNEVSVMCFRIFCGQLRKDEKVKLVLAKAGVCEWLLKLSQKHHHQSNDQCVRHYPPHARTLMDIMLTGDEVIHNIDKLIDDLNNLKCGVRLEVSQEECPNVVQILGSVANVSKTPIEETTTVVINKVLLTLLGHKSKQIVAKTAKDIAEIAKTDQGKKKCTTLELIRALIDLLKEDDIDILTQACSALWNICDENENGKNLVREQDGLKVILTVLKKGIALDNVEDASSLQIEATKFLYNFLKGQKASCMKALEEDMLPILCSILELEFQNGISNGQASVNVCITLDIMTNENIVFLDERLARGLVDIVTMDISFDAVTALCLQIFHGQAWKDEKAKLVLVKAGVCEWLLKLLQKYLLQCNNVYTQPTIQLALDLMDLMITGFNALLYSVPQDQNLI